MNCFIDIETRSGRKLHKVSLRMYAHDPSTKVLCVGYARDDQPVQIWIPDKDLAPRDLTAAWHDSSCDMVGHNIAFDVTVIERALGFPPVPLERLVDTMARARARSLPAGLDLLTRALGLEHQKDIAGKRAMLALAKPRKARKGEDPTKIYFDEDPAKFNLLCRYCLADVDATREVFRLLPPLSDRELRNWQLNARINALGLPVDRPLVMAAQQIAVAARLAINAELKELTGGRVTSVNQIARLQSWVKEHGL
jgi:DNA polymerase